MVLCLTTIYNIIMLELSILRYSVTFSIFLHCVASINLLKDTNKLSEDELQICIDNFAVHTDKIIRTQDSLLLGAKYIIEGEVDSRQDCLVLCCKTADCDVFIYEEKKQGSCYLFHCGPPHDFKCKFTTHANYSSAVLVDHIYHNQLHHDDQNHRNQQEHDLKSLRRMIERPSVEYVYTEPNIAIVTESEKSSVPSTPPSSIVIRHQSVCHRNQYECRTSHDCIAIYNVCDGIPQCSDGSDEASDLGCPTEKPTPPPPASVLQPLQPGLQDQRDQILPVADLSKYPVVLPHHKNYPPFYSNPEMLPKHQDVDERWQSGGRNDLSLHSSYGQQPLPAIQYPGQRTPFNSNNYGPGYANNWEYHSVYDANKNPNNYPPLNVFHKGDNAHYDPETSHIFNHKRPGMLVENSDGAGGGGSGSNGVGVYGESDRRYESPERPYFPRHSHESWVDGPPPIVGGDVPPRIPPTEVITALDNGNNEETHDVKKTGPIIKENTLNTDESSVLKQNLTIKKDLQVQKNVHPPKQDVSVAVAVENPANTTKHINKSTVELKTLPTNHDEPRMHHFVAERLQQNNHNNNHNNNNHHTHNSNDNNELNAVLRPRGAVISLSIGVTVTLIMAALITCRLRVVRKRGRRHGPFAHDADYLMNGMYL